MKKNTDLVSPFQVIRGGKLEDYTTSKKNFKYAEITDTRLMGVVWLHILWELPENDVNTNYHQFFYFDSEEYAFDTFESVVGSGNKEEEIQVLEITSKMKGGLGWNVVSISLKEAKYLVQEYAQMSKKLGEPLPGNTKEYKDLLWPVVEFTREEENALNHKQCISIKLPFESINYFIMRCTGKDFYAARLLTSKDIRLDIFNEHPQATLIQNRIEVLFDSITGSSSSYDGQEDGSFDTISSFRSEAVIEYDDKYYINVSEIKMKHLMIVEYNRINSFRVTESEVAMKTAQREFVSVYNLSDDAPEFLDRSTELIQNAMITPHNTGKLHMIFYPHNDHVKKQLYNLNGDVMGFYYVLDNGQIILTAYTRSNIKKLEFDLMCSMYGKYVTPVGKYQFNDSTAFEFISNDFEDFEEFVNMIALGFDDDDGRE